MSIIFVKGGAFNLRCPLKSPIYFGVFKVANYIAHLFIASVNSNGRSLRRKLQDCDVPKSHLRVALVDYIAASGKLAPKV